MYWWFLTDTFSRFWLLLWSKAQLIMLQLSHMFETCDCAVCWSIGTNIVSYCHTIYYVYIYTHTAYISSEATNSAPCIGTTSSDALKYVIFLADVNELYLVALGTLFYKTSWFLDYQIILYSYRLLNVFISIVVIYRNVRFWVGNDGGAMQSKRSKGMFSNQCTVHIITSLFYIIWCVFGLICIFIFAYTIFSGIYSISGTASSTADR